MLINYIIQWDGGETENLNDLLERKLMHSLPSSNSFNSHVVSTKKSVSIVEVVSIWMGYPGAPDYLKNNTLFLTFLSILVLYILSPVSISLLPNSAGTVLEVFRKKGLKRIVDRSKLLDLLGDEYLVDTGIDFLLERKLIELIDEDNYRLIELPLTNLRINFF